MRTLMGSFLLAVLVAVFGLSPAMAARRVALVVGNSKYENVTALTNPANDAAAVAAALKKSGFDEVRLVENLGQSQFLRALRDFSSSVSGAETALVYFAGHGVEVDGRNYLVPVDATLARSTDVEFEAISLDSVRAAVSGASKLRVVILDACRNNPFTLVSGNGKRAVTRGLARVEPGANELVAYAAREGTVANDGGGANSPYAAAIVKNIAEPNLDVRLLFGRVRDDVLAATNGEQEPFTYGTLGGGALYLNTVAVAAADPVPARTNPLPPPVVQPVSEAAQLWPLVQNTTSCAVLQSFAKRLVKGDEAFADFTQARMKELKCDAGTAVAPPPPTAGGATQQALATRPPVADPVVPVVAPVTRTLTPSIVPVGKWAEGVAFDGNALWVAESGQRTIAQLAKNGAVARRVTVGRLPVGMASLPDGRVYALVQTDQLVWEQTPGGNGRKLASLAECPQALAASQQALWVLTLPDCSSDNTRAIKIDPATGKQTQTEPFGESGEAMTFGFGKVWVAHSSGPSLSVIDPQSMKVVKSPLGGASLWAIATNKGGVFAGGRVGQDNAQGVVIAVDPATNRERARLRVGDLVIAMAADDDSVVAIGEKGTIWVASAADLTLRAVLTLGIGVYRPSSAMILNGALVIVAGQYQGENGAVLTLTNWR